MNKENWVAIMLDKEKVDELAQVKMKKFSRENIIQFDAEFRTNDMARLIRILISQIGKDKAKEIYEKETYDDYYKAGRETAEKIGNPQDLNSFINVWMVKAMDAISFVRPIIITEMTPNKVVVGADKCVIADAFLKVEDRDVLEVLKCRCCHDTAWANGFNPNIRFERTKFLVDGDDMCEFVCELD
jgi:hypothetical protein